MTFIWQHRVRFHEVDLQGYLFNSRYLELVDVAFTEYVRHLGFPYLDLMDSGSDPSVVKAALEFHRPARFEDLLDIRVRCVRVGTSSFDIHSRFLKGAVEAASATLVYVNVDVATDSSRPLPRSFAEALTRDAADANTEQEMT